MVRFVFFFGLYSHAGFSPGFSKRQGMWLKSCNINRRRGNHVPWIAKQKQDPNDHLVGGFKDFLFSPLPGEMIQFD